MRLNATLNEEEQALLNPQPEECLRHAVARGALQLDQITEGLAPHIAAVVRSIATGERLVASEAAPALSRGLSEQDRKRAEFDAMQSEWVAGQLTNHPQLASMLEERILTPGEAMEAVHAIDHTLGRYLTGTRYAAP